MRRSIRRAVVVHVFEMLGIVEQNRCRTALERCSGRKRNRSYHERRRREAPRQHRSRSRPALRSSSGIRHEQGRIRRPTRAPSQVIKLGLLANSPSVSKMRVGLYGSGRWAPGRETAGVSACCLQSASCWCVVGSLRLDCVGQGAHREVGSEGFEANRRAVAELSANRSARSRRYRACITGAEEVLGAPGRNKVFAGGTAGKQHALPREVSYGPGLTGLGT
jgi:hypothetical protein